jgi:ribosome maturation factor RimP
MISESKILALIESLLTDKKFFLVSIEVSHSNRIRVLIDSNEGIQIDDCVRVSRAIEHGLDREAEDFELEVSSPGLDAPFKVSEQYLKNIGRQVEVLMKDGHTYNGLLLEAGKTGFSVEVNKKIRQEGKKQKTVVKEIIDFVFDEVSKVRALITF